MASTAASVSAYPASGQPMFVQPGVPPVIPMAAAAPGAVYYYPQMHAGAGGILMPVPIVGQPQECVYEYKPSSYLPLSLFTLIACGIFSPLTLALSIPALLFSLKSSRNAKLGSIEVARDQGVVAAYLSVAAIIAALVVACLITGLVIGLYAKTIALYNCLNMARRQLGGEIPEYIDNHYGYLRFHC